MSKASRQGLKLRTGAGYRFGVRFFAGLSGSTGLGFPFVSAGYWRFRFRAPFTRSIGFSALLEALGVHAPVAPRRRITSALLPFDRRV